ncbi:disease resistance protein RPM1-like [Trifolium pratense]|uniref:disease resistance protein RPM1-like n=1 Tax=Trifolium pratense TaxID=57577 RepID=UPI001E68FF81|nr:disease resistance protein RPM1-like [Trifolium pratense]
MCDPCASVFSCARENLLPLARKHLFPLALDHLLPILKEGVNMIRGIPNDEIAQMKHELETIEEFIHQADKMADAEGDHPSDDGIGTREKIKQLIEASFRIQDIIDEYIIREEQQFPDPGCAAGASDYVKTKFLRLQIAHDIHSIKSQINEMKETCFETDHEGSSSFVSNLNDATSLQNLRDDPFYLDEADVVGFEKPRGILIDYMVKGRKELTAVSVVAMGGQGKTTLAKKVFDSKEVMGHFEFRVWITVSQSYDIEELLRYMLKELCKQQNVHPEIIHEMKIHEMNRRPLVEKVRNYLQQKRYVVVFDDVWSLNFWGDIKLAMIDNKKGCRILITTRTMDVATSCRESCFVEILELKGLNDEHSLKLFNKKAFHDLIGRCPENLVAISSKIVKKCDGLPLAIVVTGGLLSCKNRSYVDWYKFSENMNLELNKDSKINKLLALSYHDLPYNIKSCFLYFGLYPEDCIVPSKMLTLQWIAEGFVKEDRGRTLEEVAEGYLTMLIHRSLVQVVSITIDGRAKSCRVHDLVHAMILKKCEDLSFCKNISEDKQSSLTGMARRLSIADSSDNLMESIENSQVRSLIVYKPKKISLSFVRRIPTKYRRLKMLNIDDDRLHDVPEDLQCLSHLKYFRFRNGRGNDMYFPLPESIGMMGNLETLDLADTYYYEPMPKEICMLRKLRHFIGDQLDLIPLKDGIGGMTSLQTLPKVYFSPFRAERDNEVVELIQELGKLKQLRGLVLLNVKEEHMSVISSSINEMQQLEMLHITKINEDTFIDLDLNSPQPMLSIVKLDGRMSKKFPEWISKLQNLIELRVQLVDSMQMDDAMKLLKSMPSLLSLSISYHYDQIGVVERLHFQDGSFKNLKELHIVFFLALRYILIDEGALGSLKELQLYYIPKLMSLPTGIQHLSKLEVLSYSYPNEEFEESIALEERKEHSIFKHVLLKELLPPDINLNNTLFRLFE